MTIEKISPEGNHYDIESSEEAICPHCHAEGPLVALVEYICATEYDDDGAPYFFNDGEVIHNTKPSHSLVSIMDVTILRSLLQKLTRRGDCLTLISTIRILLRHDQKDWLVRRTPVIVAEECWPLLDKLASEINDDTRSLSRDIELLERVACSPKHKEAAVHGYFAALYLRGFLQHGLSREARIVVEAMRRPDDFRRYLTNKFPDYTCLLNLTSAKEMLPVDKCIIIAGIVMCTLDQPNEKDPPFVRPKVYTTHEDIYDSIDKHTFTGKKVLNDFHNKTGYSKKSLGYSHFYHRGALIDRHATLQSTHVWEGMITTLTPLQHVFSEDSQAYTSFVKYHNQITKPTVDSIHGILYTENTRTMQ